MDSLLFKAGAATPCASVPRVHFLMTDPYVMSDALGLSMSSQLRALPVQDPLKRTLASRRQYGHSLGARFGISPVSRFSTRSRCPVILCHARAIHEQEQKREREEKKSHFTSSHLLGSLLWGTNPHPAQRKRLSGSRVQGPTLCRLRYAFLAR